MHFDSRKMGIVAGAIVLAAAGAAVAYADSTPSEPTNAPPTATSTEPAQEVVTPETETETGDSFDEQADSKPDLPDLPPLPSTNVADEPMVADELENVDDEEAEEAEVEENEADEDLDEQADPKKTICHIPPGNPNNAHTITVGAPAVPAHLAHGDTSGPCPQASSAARGKKDKKGSPTHESTTEQNGKGKSKSKTN